MQLKAESLTCNRGGREVFRNLSFGLATGEAMVVTGRNGAGKSPLPPMIAGLVRIAAGRLSLEGGEPDIPVGEQAHYLGHQDALKPTLTVGQNLKFWSGFLGDGRAVEGALQAVDLAPLTDLPAGFLSAGQRRRLSIARLFALTRPILPLVETTS